MPESSLVIQSMQLGIQVNHLSIEWISRVNHIIRMTPMLFPKPELLKCQWNILFVLVQYIGHSYKCAAIWWFCVFCMRRAPYSNNWLWTEIQMKPLKNRNELKYQYLFIIIDRNWILSLLDWDEGCNFHELTYLRDRRYEKSASRQVLKMWILSAGEHNESTSNGW